MQQGQVRSIDKPQPQDRLQEDRLLKSWCNYGLVLLGFWLLFTAFSSDYRSLPLFWNDVIASAVMLIVGAVSFRWDWCRWINAVLGTWLLFAPLCFWAPTSLSYTNDMLTGVLAIILSFVIPGMPGKRQDVESGEEVPPGWSYNPSSWSQRLPLISLAMAGFFLARYMAAYQLGHVEHSWDPFFGNSTEKVLSSDVSRAFPVSDAGLGALSYLIDAIAGAIGGTRRWRTMPWMVLLFGFLVIPPGVVSIVLVILQPVSVGAWCSLCLLASVVMLIMVPLTIDEVIATCQYMAKVHRERLNFWSILFRGGKEISTESPQFSTTKTPIELPVNLVLCAIIGGWLMISPTFITAQSLALNNFYFSGALVVTVSFISFAQVSRSVRLLNLLFALWLLVAPFVLVGFNILSALNAILSGIALGLFTIKRGTINTRYGTWNRFII